MKSFYFILLILLFNNSLQAQSTVLTKPAASELIRRINQQILNSKHYSANMEYRVFQNHKDSQPLETMSGFYRRSGLNEHSMLLGIETIQNDRERVLVDTAGQSVALSNPVAKPQLIEASMQAALGMCNSISLKKSGPVSTLIFMLAEDAQAGFNQLEITFSEQTYFITAVTMYYVHTNLPGFDQIKNPKITIAYSDISNSKVSGSEFSTHNIINHKNDQYTLTAAFKAYTFFNQFNTTPH